MVGIIFLLLLKMIFNFLLDIFVFGYCRIGFGKLAL